jgi:hypothetical protein
MAKNLQHKPASRMMWETRQCADIENLQQIVLVSESAWVRSFAKSMCCHGMNPGWRPTAKQAAVMRDLIDDHIFGGDQVIDVHDE